MIRAFTLPLLMTLLAGCSGVPKPQLHSVAGSECKVFEPPPYAVAGKTPYDQDWIDSTIEGGVGACRWQRPAARPPELDGKPAMRPATKPPGRRGLVRRIKDRWRPTPAPAPSWPPAASPVVAAPSIEPAPAPAVAPPQPRSKLDQLLHPDRK